MITLYTRGKEYIYTILVKCPSEQQQLFRRMYGYNVSQTASLYDVVMNMDNSKVENAIMQIERTCV